MNKTKITVRLDDSEYNHLKKISADSGMKMEPFIRNLIMGKSVCPRPPDDYYNLLHEINAIGVNINQIARIANSERKISNSRIEYAVRLVDEIMEKVRDFE